MTICIHWKAKCYWPGCGWDAASSDRDQLIQEVEDHIVERAHDPIVIVVDMGDSECQE